MKKILCLCAFALLVTLTGCKDAKTSLTNGSEALITVGKTEITKDQIYTALKSENGVTAIISKLTNFVIDKEVPVTEEIEKEAKDYLDSFIEYMGKDTMMSYIKTFGYTTLDDYYENVIITSTRANKITDNYVKECYEDLNKKYELRKVQILQLSDSKLAAEIHGKIKEGTLTFETALTEYKDKLNTTTYTGKEQVISNAAALDGTVLANIYATEEDNTLLPTYLYNNKIDTFYVVKMLETNVSEEDGFNTLVTIDSVDDEAFAYYLEKHGFVVYDIDLYNGIKAEAPVYLVQDNK